MAKPSSTDLAFTFTAIGQSSGYNNLMGAWGESGTVSENVGSTQTYGFNLSEASSEYAYLSNDPAQALTNVRYFADMDGDGVVESGDDLVFEGAPSAFTFASLITAAAAEGTTRFVAMFDDSYNGGPDTDFNDIVVSVSLSGGGGKHANAGRGNGSEYGFDSTGHLVELDPGNSGGHNNGGDFGVL